MNQIIFYNRLNNKQIIIWYIDFIIKPIFINSLIFNHKTYYINKKFNKHLKNIKIVKCVYLFNLIISFAALIIIFKQLTLQFCHVFHMLCGGIQNQITFFNLVKLIFHKLNKREQKVNFLKVIIAFQI